MKVALSVDALSPELTGIGRYCVELVQRLPAIPSVAETTYWRGNDKIPNPWDLIHGRLPPRPKIPWIHRRVRRLATRLGLRGQDADWPRFRDYDIFHAPNFMLPPWVEHGVTTVHDLSVVRYPETHPQARIAAFQRDFSSSLARSTHIITPTEAVRNEVLDYTGFDPHRVTAVPMGVGAHFEAWPEARRAPVLDRLRLPRSGYGLTVSTLEPRKRIDLLVAAWGRLPVALRRRFPLVICGASGWENDILHDKIREAAAEGWLIPLGYVREEDLPPLYSGATIFVYPSLYEGFGLPPVEAMACGVPTLVADSSCLPEVTAGASMLVDPEDGDGFTLALQQGLTDDCWRRATIDRGNLVAQGYSWDICIDKTLDVYRIASQS